MKSHLIPALTPTPKCNALDDFLEEKFQKASEYRFPPMGLIDVLRTDPKNLYSRAPHLLREMSSGLEDLITSDPRFLGHTVKMVQTINGASGFYPQFVGPTFLQRIIDAGSVSAGIAWLQKVLSTQVAEGKFITALWNVPVESAVQLTNDVLLVPFDDLPHSTQKTAIENSKYQQQIIPSLSLWAPPSSALVVSHHVDPFLCDGSPRDDGKYSVLYESLSDITLLLTLIGPRVAIQVAHWFNFDDSDLELALLGQSTGYKTMEILPTPTGQEWPTLNAKEAIKIIEEFDALVPRTKEKIKIATDRLRRALLRHQPADMAVEISIALEILCGDSQTSEMTHKVKVRAVRLLGGDESVRDRNRTILTKTYEVRSQLVHQGIHHTKPISVSGVPMDVGRVISEACHLCAELIKTVIGRGGLPDWLHFDVNDHGSTLDA